jgi:hypothetical protein
VPVTVGLKYTQPKTVSSRFGERFMFTTPDDRVMFCDAAVAQAIAQLGINVNEPFTITRLWDGRKDSQATWDVRKLPKAQAGPGEPPPTARLVAEANALVDAFAQVLQRTLDQYQGRIKPEEARTLLISAYNPRAHWGDSSFPPTSFGVQLAKPLTPSSPTLGLHGFHLHFS